MCNRTLIDLAKKANASSGSQMLQRENKTCKKEQCSTQVTGISERTYVTFCRVQQVSISSMMLSAHILLRQFTHRLNSLRGLRGPRRDSSSPTSSFTSKSLLKGKQEHMGHPATTHLIFRHIPSLCRGFKKK